MQTTELKHKILSTLIVSLSTFLGFEAISYSLKIYQISTTLWLSLLIYFFHIFWLSFIFDLHLKNRSGKEFMQRVEHFKRWEYLRHYQNYLVLPGLLYWSTVVLLFINPFDAALKQVLLITSTAALAVAYWYMKEHLSRKLEVKHEWLKVLSIVKLFAAFFVYAAVIGVTIHNGFDTFFLGCAIFTLTFLLIYQALFAYNFLNFRIIFIIVLIAIVLTLVSVWVYSVWNAEYFSAALILLAVYNTLWGLLHHYLDKTLSKAVAFEYVLMMIFVVTFVLASHNFQPRVI
jgi:hypothetical protein